MAKKLANRVTVVEGDITQQEVDAIVNAANTTLLGGGGVDGAIHHAAGPKLREECESLGGCETGNAKITGGYELPAKFVIHAVGPVWYGGNRGEYDLLASAYQQSLERAVENEIETIAFPSISTGAYRFPIDRAARIAVKTIKGFLEEDDSIEEVRLVCFSEEAFDVYEKAVKEILA